jgi:dipeptidyl aminopeptidase/acylaminoacyl peptidase
VVVADATTGAARVLARDEDPLFWSMEFLGAEPVPSPDGRFIAFLSDRDGWDHLYLVPSAGGEPRQLTRGAFEVSRPAWSPDGRRIAFDTNEGDNPGARQLVVAEIGDGVGPARLETITAGRGTNVGGQWTMDGHRLLYQHTDPRTPAELRVVEARPGAPPRRLGDPLPASIDRTALVEPRFVRYDAPDGKKVPAYLFVPPALDRARKHPAIVWVHGDGITQNFDGWHVRRDYAVYYSVHQYLLQRGYVVLSVDYRGSIGYGKAWRQGHYRDLGGADYRDIAAGVDYMKTLGYVDTARVGVWGLSYGGFMALQALTVTPELFRCAIDVAGVDDWADWYHDPDGPWIRGRMGRPEENPELYRRTSPIHFVDKIVRPLLVLHGTADVNVPYIESLRVVDAALKAGKDVGFMTYPGEYHYFHRAHVLRDAWSRVERFFDMHLQAPH